MTDFESENDGERAAIFPDWINDVESFNPGSEDITEKIKSLYQKSKAECLTLNRLKVENGDPEVKISSKGMGIFL